MSEQRQHHLARFYDLLDRLESKLGGTRRLSECTGRMDWPRRGVYFFREAGENRTDTGDGQRIVRVGTHAVTTSSKTKLWERLRQHKGTVKPPGGKHRSSVFRKIIGAALIEQNGYDHPTWGRGSSAPKDVTESERDLERTVSGVIGNMPFLWLAVEDEAGPDSCRGYIERNAIALLSSYKKEPIDRPSPQWLGHRSDRERVRLSGLWNSNHVDDDYDPAFLDALQQLIERM